MTKVGNNVENPNFWEKSIGKWLLSLASSVATWVIGTSFIGMVDTVLNKVDLSQINWGVAMLGGLCITALYWITVWSVEQRSRSAKKAFDARTKKLTAENLIQWAIFVEITKYLETQLKADIKPIKNKVERLVTPLADELEILTSEARSILKQFVSDDKKK